MNPLEATVETVKALVGGGPILLTIIENETYKSDFIKLVGTIHNKYSELLDNWISSQKSK